MSEPVVLAFRIDRERLASAVDRVAKVVHKRNTIPILANILIKAEGDAIELRATDLDVDASLRVEGATIAVPGELTVPAGEFRDALKRWPDGVLSIESDTRRLTAKVARSRASFPVLPAVDFPDIRKSGARNTFQIPGSDLSAMVARCGFAVSTEETRYYLNGIFLHVADDRLVAVATDGHRLSRLEMPMAEGAEDMQGVIIPRRTIGLWPNLLGEDESEPVTIEVAENFIRFGSEAMVLHSQLVEGTYPDYTRVIPRGNNRVALANLADLAAAVDRLLVFTGGEKGRGLSFSFAEGELTISIRSDSGEAEEVLPAECGFDLNIGFNGKYLRELLGTLKGPKVRFALADPGSPSTIADEEDLRRDIVLMPMRF